MAKDFYDTLGVAKGADDAALKVAYRKVNDVLVVCKTTLDEFILAQAGNSNDR